MFLKYWRYRMVASTRMKILHLIVGVGLFAACSDSGSANLGPDPTTQFASVSVGLLHTCALTTSGQAYCWGWREKGQLGNGGTIDSDVPAAVHGDLTAMATERAAPGWS